MAPLTKFESFPFLEIARTYGVDYGDVLVYAQAQLTGGNEHNVYAMRRLPDDAKRAVVVMLRKPAGDRRGTPRAG